MNKLHVVMHLIAGRSWVQICAFLYQHKILIVSCLLQPEIIALERLSLIKDTGLNILIAYISNYFFH